MWKKFDDLSKIRSARIGVELVKSALQLCRSVIIAFFETRRRSIEVVSRDLRVGKWNRRGPLDPDGVHLIKNYMQ